MDKIIIQGIPFDGKSSFKQGPALAPEVIRKTLNNGASNYFSESGINIQTEQIIDVGDLEIERYEVIAETVQTNLDIQTRVLTLGGDHSITFPVFKALRKHYAAVDILHIDAHADLYHDYQGDPYSHACPFARIMEEKLSDRLVQIGIRTLNDHQRSQAEKFGVEIHEMRHFNMESLPEFHRPLYISLDMDAFDPGFAPGVSHHEPGGLSPRQVIDLLQSIKAPVIGADIVELNPTRDHCDMTAALAAKMMKEILALMIQNNPG